jgi:hypothetical protein
LDKTVNEPPIHFYLFEPMGASALTVSAGTQSGCGHRRIHALGTQTAFLLRVPQHVNTHWNTVPPGKYLHDTHYTRIMLCAARLRRRLTQPLFLIGLVAALIAIIVQSGDLGSSDAQHRLQTAHSFWTSEPPVFPNEFPDFGVRGRNGKIQSFYGIGQSLLFLPADIAGELIEELPTFAKYNGNDPAVRTIVVCYLVSIFVNVVTALICAQFLALIGFSRKQVIAGVLALLLATTHLLYTQVLQENNYIFLLTISGLAFQYEWASTSNRRALVIGSAAFGLNLLTRITTGIDLMAGGIFVLLTLWFEGLRGHALRKRIGEYYAVATPIYIFFGFLDRLYQFYRFGSFWTTYMGLTAKEMRQRDPALPANFPFSAPFHEGFFGALFSPEKSIFLFDPLLIVIFFLMFLAWKHFTPAVRAYQIAMAAMLVAYVSFYAHYFAWAGDFAWGDRYVSTAVQFAVLLAVPLLIRFRRELGSIVFWSGAAICAIAVVVQATSVAFWYSLEEYQLVVMRRPVWVVPLRFENILDFALGKTRDWSRFMPLDDVWAQQHITCWNFLPFQLQHAGQAPEWVVTLVLTLWTAALIALAGTLTQLWRSLQSEN